MAFNDDEKPSTSNLGSTKGLVMIQEPTYSRDHVGMTADEVTVVLELVATPFTTVREGLDLVAVLDVSGRMEGENLARMKKGMQCVIEMLTPVDRLSIVVFSYHATRLCPLRSVTQPVQADFTAIVDGLVVGGEANIEAGIDVALAVIADRTTTRARNATVFLLSDGQAIHGDARRSDTSKIAVYTFGLGIAMNRRLLSDVARKSAGGKFRSVENWQKDVTPLFSRVLGRLHTVVAQDVRLTLTPKKEDGFVSMRVAPRTDYTQTTDGDTGVITIKFGTLFAGETREVAVNITLLSTDISGRHDAVLAEAQHSITAQSLVQVIDVPRTISILRIPNPFEDPAPVSRMAQTGSKPPLPLQYLKDITSNFCDERILGKGGFGVVYKGVQQNGEMVAVKKLLHAMPSSQKQFENEVNLLMTLEHPNIVRLIGYCYETQHLHTPHEGKSVFAWHTESLICLECLPNGSLDKYISDASSGLDWHTRWKIIEGISYGLQYLHEHSNEPIIHLDLKPANILLDANMAPKITDFGLSRLFDQTQTIHTALTSGTLGYMPPEFVRGIITPMSDIFSLGVIIMEVITGHRDYPYDIRKSSDEFIERELQNWRNRPRTDPGYASLETDCTQIERCIQIGLICVNPERAKRPKMKKIVNMLQGMENMNCYITNEVIPPAAPRTSGSFVAYDAFGIFLSLL